MKIDEFYKFIFIGLLSIFMLEILGCSLNSCELKYYERISKIDLPDKIEIIECVDNGEFITTGIFKIRKEDISEFLKINNFLKVNLGYKPEFLGMNWLSKNNLQFPNLDKLYKIEGRTSDNTWYFLVDSESGIIWAEIRYPDWGGTPP